MFARSVVQLEMSIWWRPHALSLFSLYRNSLFSFLFASYSLSDECHRMTLTTHFRNDCTRRQHQFISICIFSSFYLLRMCVSLFQFSYDFRLCLLSVSNCIAIAIAVNITREKTATRYRIRKKVKRNVERKRRIVYRSLNSFQVIFFSLSLECACHVHTLGSPCYSFSRSFSHRNGNRFSVHFLAFVSILSCCHYLGTNESF